MKNLRSGVVMGCCMMLAAGPIAAQQQDDRAFRPGTLHVSLLAGGSAYSDLHRSTGAGALDAAGPQRLSAATTGTIGFHIGYWFTPHWGVRAHGAFAPSRFDRIPSSGAQPGTAQYGESDATPLAPLQIWTWDVGIAYRLPVNFGGIAPYGVIGAGALDYRAADGADVHVPAETRTGFGNGGYRQLVGLIGAGVFVPLAWRGTLLTFEVTSHVGRTPPRPAIADGAGSGDAGAADDPLLNTQVRFLIGATVPLATRRAPAAGSPPDRH
jgi:hypothetical protein